MSLCDPCGRTFVEMAKLLNMLKGENAITPEARAQMDVVFTRLRMNGDYLITKEILEIGYGKPGHMNRFLE